MQEGAIRLRVPHSTGKLIIMLNPLSRFTTEGLSHQNIMRKSLKMRTLNQN